MAFGRNRRVPRKGFTQLTTKQGPRGYYKGKGAASTGRHTKQGACEPGVQACRRPADAGLGCVCLPSPLP